MTLDQKIGQTLCVGFIGPTFTAELEQLIRELHLGCLFLFTSNIDTPTQVAQLVREVQTAARASGNPPLIIALDQEGGAVSRLTQEKGFTEFPGAMGLAATPDAFNNARIVGQVMARELKAIGVNMNLAPSLDVNTNALNPIIGVRSFGSDPDAVAQISTALIEAMQTEGIMAVGKHFPGHGSVAQDSHIDLPTADRDRATLDTVDLVPFRSAIRANVAAVMTAHIRFTALDAEPRPPATLSRNALTGLLRDELRFDGVLMTDSLDMGALRDNGYPVPIAAALALQAGADVLSMNSTFVEYRTAFAEIKTRVTNGEIPLARLDEAARRVLRAKERFGVMDAPLPDPTSVRVGNIDDRARINAIIGQSLTLVHNEAGLIPLPAGESLFVIETPYTYGLSGSLGAAGTRVTEDPSNGEIANVVAQAQGRVALVTTSDALLHPSQVALVRALMTANIKTIVWAVKSPYDIGAFKDLPNLTALASYGTPPYLLIEPVKAALSGKMQMQVAGRLPVEVP
jgi:beta-N-acetylhexosaminidase